MFTGWAWNRKLVTTPKLPPPPRSAQKRSGILRLARGDEAAVGEHHVGFEQVVDGEAVFAREVAVPPPSVSPATPVVETMPNGTARPKACVAWSTSPEVQPAPTRTVRSPGSTRTPFIIDRSMTSPSSTLPRPGPLWPPPRMAMQQIVVAAEIDRGDDVGDVGAARDQQRPLVDHAVVELAGLVVVGVRRARSTSPRRLCANLSIASSFMMSSSARPEPATGSP